MLAFGSIMYFDVIPVKSLSFIHTIRPRLVSPAKRHHVVFLTLLQPLSPTKAQIYTICRYHNDYTDAIFDQASSNLSPLPTAMNMVIRKPR